TVRALKMHGGVAVQDLGAEDLAALERGMANLHRHISNLQKYGLPVIVAVNAFTTDTTAELELVQRLCQEAGTEAVRCTHWADGGKGAVELAEKVMALSGAQFAPLYPLELSLTEKMRTIAREIYGAAGVDFSAKAAKAIADFEALGHGGLAVCVAKTQYSFSADPSLRGAPTGHVIPVVDARLSAGAGFVVMLCGEVMTLPGLPKEPAAHRIGLDAAGQVVGLS
ncbi:MAG: formate--tetrahydrofolate ligase, partial [Frankiales bacterium]|nr:formate--tetrahydrofolate ligase [Frankiales bacterium]